MDTAPRYGTYLRPAWRGPHRCHHRSGGRTEVFCDARRIGQHQLGSRRHSGSQWPHGVGAGLVLMPTEFDSPRLRSLAAFASPSSDQFALELRKGAEHGYDQPSMGDFVSSAQSLSPDCHYPLLTS